MKDYSGPSSFLAPWTALPRALQERISEMLLLWLLPVNLTDQEQLMLITRATFLGVSDLEEVVEIR